MFTDYNYWCVVPVLACHVGAVAGAWAYYLAIMNNWAEDDKEKEVPAKKEKNGDARNGKGRHYLQVLGYLISMLTYMTTFHFQYADMYQPTQSCQPPKNPSYAHTRPHTPDEEKYQPLPKQAEMQNGSRR